MTTPSILRMPTTRAQARRRRHFTLTLLAAATATTLVAATHDDSSEPCYITPNEDGTWSPVNFDPTAAAPPADCEFAVWQDKP